MTDDLVGDHADQLVRGQTGENRATVAAHTPALGKEPLNQALAGRDLPTYDGRPKCDGVRIVDLAKQPRATVKVLRSGASDSL